MWLIIKHKTTGELSLVNRFVREHQLQLWTSNGIVVPSFVLKTFDSIEEASDYLIEIQKISEMINNILKKDEEKFGSDSNL